MSLNSAILSITSNSKQALTIDKEMTFINVIIGSQESSLKQQRFYADSSLEHFLL